MSEISGNTPLEPPVFQPYYPQEQLERRGVLVTRNVNPESAGVAFEILQEEFGDLDVAPLGGRELLRLTVVGRYESARAIIDASNIGAVVSTASVHQALHEEFPRSLRRGLTSYTRRFHVEERVRRGFRPLISLEMTSETFPATRDAATDIIDSVAGAQYPWAPYRALVPIGHLALDRRRQDITEFVPKKPLAVGLSHVIIHYKRRKPR